MIFNKSSVTPSNGGGTINENKGGIEVEPETKKQYVFVISQTYISYGLDPETESNSNTFIPNKD